MKTREDEAVDTKIQSAYWSGVGKLIHMMKWSWPDVLNVVQDFDTTHECGNLVSPQGNEVGYGIFFNNSKSWSDIKA